MRTDAPPASSAPASPGAPSADACAVVELRQYTLHPGRREALVGLFEREFVETQEALGMALLGQFRDLDDADRFVWLRGFAGMDARREALEAFYSGPAWQAHRDAANATMRDSDDVLLLRPAWPGAGLRFDPARRAARGASAAPPGLVDVSVFPLQAPADAALLAFCRDTMTAVLAEAGATGIAWYVTEDAPNDFPRLPVREGEQVLVGVAVFGDAAHHDAFVAGKAWDRRVAPTLARWAGPARALRLSPTPRSALHG